MSVTVAAPAPAERPHDPEGPNPFAGLLAALHERDQRDAERYEEFRRDVNGGHPLTAAYGPYHDLYLDRGDDVTLPLGIGHAAALGTRADVPAWAAPSDYYPPLDLDTGQHHVKGMRPNTHLVTFDVPAQASGRHAVPEEVTPRAHQAYITSSFGAGQHSHSG